MSDEDAKAIEEWVEQAQSAGPGDHRAFHQLVSRFRGNTLANCKFLTRSETDAEDLAQEVFVKAFFAIKKLEERAKFGSWLKRIKVNHCLNFIRKRKGQGTHVDIETPEAEFADAMRVDADHSSDFNEEIEKRQIREILASMPDNMRIPLVLCDMDGFSYQEAADQLGIGLSALKMRLKRAREQFRTRYTARTGNRHPKETT